jgi:hypothetical protein
VQPDETQWTTVTPPSYERVYRRVLGLAPGGLAAAATLLTLAAAGAGLATGDVVVGVLLLLAACLLGAIYVERARHHRASSAARIAAAAVDHTRALAGFAGATAGVWTRAGRDVARLRLEAHRLARERSELQYALGGAAYDEDAERVVQLRTELTRCVERIDGCAAAAREAVQRARSRTADERRVVAATQVRKPGATR